ncbi:MAG TPA: phosphodiester glycosidase family protein [bacterium]|jgi:hypothetical protein
MAKTYSLILRNILILLILMAVFSPFADASETISDTEITQDIHFTRYRPDDYRGSVVSMVRIKIDAIKNNRLMIDAVPGGTNTIWGTSSPANIGTRTDAYAVINGPYFASSGGKTYPLGFSVIDGILSQLGLLNRPLIGISDDGVLLTEICHPRAFVTSDAYFDPLWLWGINSPAGPDNVTLYDSRWGSSVGTQGGTGVSISPPEESDTITIEIDSSTLRNQGKNWDGEVTDVMDSGSLNIPENGYVLIFRGRSESDAARYPVGSSVSALVYELPEEYEELPWMCTLGPWFVNNGHFREYSDETNYDSSVTARATRSCIGTTWNNEIFFAVITGNGLNISETAEALIDCNVREAVMCDSGSSSGLWIKGVGNVRGSSNVPLYLVVRDYEEEDYPELKIYEGTIR